MKTIKTNIMKNSLGMKFYLICFSFVFLLISCKKDEIIETPIDYNSFMLESNYTFRGNLEGESFVWSYGIDEYQLGNGYENPYGICDSTNFERILECGLASNEEGKPKYIIYTPAFNVKNITEFANVFSVGKKKLGSRITDFFLVMQKDEKQYFTNANSDSNEIEILKTEEYLNNFGQPRLKVWFKLEANLSDCDCQSQTNKYKLTNGCLLAEFYGYK